MSKLKLSLYIILGVVLIMFFNNLLNSINPNSLFVTISIKCFQNTSLALEYKSKKDASIKRVEKMLVPAQICLPVTFELKDFDDSQFLHLYLGDSVRTVFIESFLFSVKLFSQTKYIYYWNPGQESATMISDVQHCYIANKNTQSMQIETSNEINMLDLNIKSLAGTKDYINSASLVSYKIWIACFALAMYLLLIFISPSSSGKLNIDIRIHAAHPLIILFWGILCFCMINSVFRWIPDLNTKENRALSAVPAYSFQSTYQYPDLISKYTDDHFPFRNYLFYLNSFLRLKYFNEAVLPDKVIVGKNDFFFYNDEISINNFRHLSAIDTASDNQVISNFSLVQEWLEKRECKYFILFAPDKGRIYSDYMPSRYTVKPDYKNNTFDYYKAILFNNDRLTLIDPTDSLKLSRKKYNVYYLGDTHWNYYGAFKAYQCIMNELTPYFPTLTSIQEDDLIPTESYNHPGDLITQLGLSGHFPKKEMLFQFKDSAYSIDYDNLPLIQCIFRENKTINNSQLKLIVFGDSFSYFLMPYLNKHFEQSIYVRHYSILPSLIEKEKPDVVIFESVERFLNYSLFTPLAIQVE